MKAKNSIVGTELAHFIKQKSQYAPKRTGCPGCSKNLHMGMNQDFPSDVLSDNYSHTNFKML